MGTQTDRVTDTGAAVATGVSSVVPLPFVGDWIVTVSRRQMAKQTLLRHGRTFNVADLSTFYGEEFSWLGLPWRFVRGLILAPIKRLLRALFVVLAFRDVALNVGRTLAMNHTLDRMVRGGSFRDDDSAATRQHEAKRLRRAFDVAYGGIDERLVRRAVAAVRDQIGRAARGAVGVVDTVPADDVEGFLTELDRRVDEALLGRQLT